MDLNKTKNVELVQTLVEKSWADVDFKNKLIESPISTIEQITGKTANLTVRTKIIVEDQSNDSVIYLNIPSEPNLEELELSESQLELVAGGASPLLTLVVIGFVGTWALDKIF